jgi:hypothetical protein
VASKKRVNGNGIGDVHNAPVRCNHVVTHFNAMLDELHPKLTGCAGD